MSRQIMDLKLTKTKKMSNLDNNILIAEFMGMQVTDLGWYDSEEAMSEYACQIVGGSNTFEVLQYDRSWDWLIPVVDSCFDVAEDGDMVEIMHHLQVAVKDEVYREVIQFIDEYNARKL